MSRGGSHGRGGPPPDPNALRRERDGLEWVTLPPARVGDPPAWPLTRATKRELVLWAREWRRPQAVVWERNGQEAEVALYVRSLVAAERPSASVASRTLVRQQQEALGLSVNGLARNRWRIVAEDAPIARQAVARSVRDRFCVVQDTDQEIGAERARATNEGGL